MTANPNPKRISDEMWKFWLWFKALEPTAKLGGIYAEKRGYHNARENLPASDYSRRLPNDLLGDKTKASAIDLTMPLAGMKKYSKRLMAAGKNPKDTRTRYLKEFFGNCDGNRVVDGWDFGKHTTSSSDASHLWHIHISVTRRYLNDPKAFAALRSILSGQTLENWLAHQGPTPAKPPAPKPVYVVVKRGDTLTKIAARVKLTLAKLLALNPLKKKNPNALDVGEKVRVK